MPANTPPPASSSPASSSPAWWYETDGSLALGLSMTLLHEEQTPYQHLQVYAHDRLGRVLVLDGILQTTTADEFVYHEMLAHVPLLGSRTLAQDRCDVLVVGGGDGGTLREVLRHEAVTRAVMVELDEAVVRASEEHLGFGPDYDDPRVELRFADAARYVEEAPDASFDVILTDSTDPVGPGEVLFTPDFIRHSKRCLRPGGVFARHLCMPPYQPDVLREGTRRIQAAFGAAEVYRATIPTYLGASMAFVATTADGRSVAAPRQPFTGRHYNAALHRAAFALPTWWQELLEG